METLKTAKKTFEFSFKSSIPLMDKQADGTQIR